MQGWVRRQRSVSTERRGPRLSAREGAEAARSVSTEFERARACARKGAGAARSVSTESRGPSARKGAVAPSKSGRLKSGFKSRVQRQFRILLLARADAQQIRTVRIGPQDPENRRVEVKRCLRSTWRWSWNLPYMADSGHPTLTKSSCKIPSSSRPSASRPRHPAMAVELRSAAAKAGVHRTQRAAGSNTNALGPRPRKLPKDKSYDLDRCTMSCNHFSYACIHQTRLITHRICH